MARLALLASLAWLARWLDFLLGLFALLALISRLRSAQIPLQVDRVILFECNLIPLVATITATLAI